MEDIRQQTSGVPNEVVDPQMFPNDQKQGKFSVTAAAMVFVAFCALGFVAVYAVT